MLFFCLPISGAFLGAQIGGLLLTLKALQKHPDLVFSSSGGNIVSYLGHCCNWDITRIENSFIFIDSEFFITNWFFDKIPFLSFLLNKTVYTKGYGFDNFFKLYYSPNIYTGYSVKAENGTEILTGVVVCSQYQNYHKIYSNKKKENSFFKDVPKHSISPYLCEAEEIEYLEGNVKKISNMVLDSAAIPFVIPSREDDNKNFYSDGGTLHASPLSCLTHVLKEKGDILKGIYINCSSCDIEPECSININQLKNLCFSIATSDIRAFINLITSFPNMTPFKSPIRYEKLTVLIFSDLIKQLEQTNYHYGILLFPNEQFKNKIKLNCKVRVKEIQEDVNYSYENLNCYVWRKI